MTISLLPSDLDSSADLETLEWEADIRERLQLAQQLQNRVPS